MTATLECWSSRANTDEGMVEQVLMRNQDRSKGLTPVISSAKESSLMQKKLQKLSRNVLEAIAYLKNSLNLDSARDAPSKMDNSSQKVVWGSVVRNLTQLYLGSQLVEKLMSNIRRHYASLLLRSDTGEV